MTTAERLDKRIVLLIAFACGTTIANIYYAQPLLDEIGDEFGVGTATVGLLMTASQIGYAIGVALLAPLGDLLERRRLTVQMLAGCAVALALTAVAPDFTILAAALLIVGVTSAVAQVLVPMAASLAAEEERGRVVGIVMSGLLIGILLARTVSGLLAELGGWRLPYIVATALALALVVAIRKLLPASRASIDLDYRGLLWSVPRLVREEPVLRRRMIYGASNSICFFLVWTALTFLLTDTYGYGEATIGLFGLFGVVGAASAQLAGRSADRGWLNRSTFVFASLMLLGWGVLAFGESSIVAIIIGLIVLDFAMQGMHISNQTAIYALRPDARGRMTTAYMVTNFTCAALASAAAAIAYETGGWTAVVVLGALVAAINVGNWVQERFSQRTAAATS